MALYNPGITGSPAFGSRVDTRIVYAPHSYIPESPVELPTSEGGASTFSITIEAADLPTGNPYPLPFNSAATFVQKYNCYVVAYVSNPTAGNVVVYCRRKASTSGFDSSGRSVSVVAGQYGGFISLGISDAAIGATQEARMWAGGAGVLFTGAYMVIVPKLPCGVYPKGLADFQMDFSGTSLLSGTAIHDAQTTYKVTDFRGSSSYQDATSISAGGFTPTATLAVNYPNWPASYLWKTAATEKPHYGFYYPTRLAFTPLL